MSQLKKVEATMDEYLVKKAPFQIPSSGRKAIVEWAPWISLIVGVLSLIAALSLWQAGHKANQVIDATNDFLRAYGGDTVSSVPELSVFFYVAIVALVAQAALMIYAFPGLKVKSKAKGWTILLLSSLINLVYGVFVAFTDYGSFSNLFFSLIGSLVGLYILAQIRSNYGADKKAKKA